MGWNQIILDLEYSQALPLQGMPAVLFYIIVTLHILTLVNQTLQIKSSFKQLFWCPWIGLLPLDSLSGIGG